MISRGIWIVPGRVENTVRIAHLLQVNVSVGRVHGPVSFDQAQRQVLRWIGATGVLSGSDNAGSVGENEVAEDAAPGVDADVARLRAECSGTAIIRHGRVVSCGEIADNISTDQ